MFEDSMIKAFLTLAGSVGIIALLFYILKKYAKKVKNTKNAVELEVLSRINLSPKSHLYVVKAGSKTLLLGATDSNVSILSDLNDKNSSDDFDFSGADSEELKRFAANAKPAGKSDDSLSFSAFLKSAFKGN